MSAAQRFRSDWGLVKEWCAWFNSWAVAPTRSPGDLSNITCDVIAPSLIPIKSGGRVKTDKRDAARLAKALRANTLVSVNIPDDNDEAIRDLCRARTDAVDDLRCAKTRHLALVPSESTSAKKRKQGGITPTEIRSERRPKQSKRSAGFSGMLFGRW